MAILPEFGGSNLGVPVEEARDVLGSVPQGESSSPVSDYPTP